MKDEASKRLPGRADSHLFRGGETKGRVDGGTNKHLTRE